MAANREPRGVPSGGRFAPKSHSEADLGAPLVGPADELEVGKQYMVTYTVTDEDGSTESQVTEIVYSGEQGPFIKSDDGSMVRKDLVTKVVSNDPYEKALAAHGLASQELHDACVTKVANLVRNIEPQAASIGFVRDPDGALGPTASAGYVVTNRGAVLRFDDEDTKFDEATVRAMDQYLDSMLDASDSGLGDYEMDLSTGAIDDRPPRGREAAVRRVADTVRSIIPKATKVDFSWDPDKGVAQHEGFSRGAKEVKPTNASYEDYEKLDRQLAELMADEDDFGSFDLELRTGEIESLDY